MIMGTLKIDQIKEFICYTGWELYTKANEYLEIWRFEEDDRTHEILLPTEAAVDKELLLSLAIRKLSTILNKPEVSLIEEISAHSDHAIAIRVIHTDVHEGTIPLDDGILLNQNAKELLVAAANAALERRPLYQGRLPIPVSALIQNARLGQTAHGSYVVRIFCPEFEHRDAPVNFTQSTTRTLESALTSLREAIQSYQKSNDPIAFERALTNGVSANLCDAIANISGKNQERAVQISLKAPSTGKLIPTETRTFEFLPQDQESIKIASKYFRQTYTLKNQTVIGVIERLDRRAQQSDGAVRIATTLSNGVKRSVSLQLTLDQYQEAIRAHDTKLMVRVTGDVIVTPRTASLINWRDFSVVGNLPLFDS
ncbi:hypothetical protein [Ectopseudomonas guguanensis]|jgi:hypothetical protein|uniref:hypothetical protein n=1 Tax=Ectopseudomonas guguanensis TaxID=1198456 RepID=UPI00285B2CFB|nr:hypothetical protein [Pseudomonas guguanensis]MDR8017157.1 hypothetical protein [Pseudomonas guguanensis]